MGFYEDFAVCYETIFPTDSDTLDFLHKQFPAPPAKLLDLGCATGGYSRALARLGYEVTGVDLNESMIIMARRQATGIDGLRFFTADMVNPPVEENVAGWFCIGNSLVHLPYGKTIRTALQNWKELLIPGGVWIVQILNYDRILKYNITKLPTIEAADGAQLARYYEHISNRTIIFYTELTYQDKKYYDRTPLYPINRADLREFLQEVGLRIVKEYGEFDGSPWTEESFAYVVCGTS